MSKITTADTRKIAQLARLALTPDEVEKFGGQLERILEYVDTLAEVNVDGVAPFSVATVTETALRADVVGAGLPRAAALQNAPQSDEQFFIVPAVVKE